MANNPFSDFSALKSLKKELEKQDDSNNPSKAANEPRRKTVTHKSKDDVLGDQKARETGLQPGMRVTLMDSSDRGVIKRVRKDCVEMTVDEHHLTARAYVTSDHRKIPFCRVEITNEHSELIASGTSLGYRKTDAMEFDSLM